MIKAQSNGCKALQFLRSNQGYVQNIKPLIVAVLPIVVEYLATFDLLETLTTDLFARCACMPTRLETCLFDHMMLRHQLR
jgi:hypothetical protein